MPTRRSVIAAAGLGLALLPAARPARGAGKNPRYYFRITEINIEKAGDPALSDVAREVLEHELGSRAEFTSDLGGVTDDRAVPGELKKRGLQGFRVSLRLDKVGRELKPPKPGGRLKQLAVDVKLSVFGTTLPGEKLAFGGDGEAAVEAEVVERRLEEESAALVKDVMAQAVKQAVDQAVMKLSLPRSQPMNERKRPKRKK